MSSEFSVLGQRAVAPHIARLLAPLGAGRAGRLHLASAECLGSTPRSTSLCLSFPICEMGIETVPVSEACWKDWRNSHRMCLRTVTALALTVMTVACPVQDEYGASM